MTKRFLMHTLMACSVAAGLAVQLSAGTVTYQIDINTAGLAANTASFVDFQFNQASTNSLSGLATVDSLSSVGYTFDEGTTVFSTGVTGSRISLPISIPNDVGGINYYAQGVSVFGSTLSVFVTLSGPVIGGTATDPSQFFVFLEDSSGAPLFGAEVASLLVNDDGTTTTAGSTFAGGFATVGLVSTVPEPSTFLLGAGLMAGLGVRFQRVR